ncbi:hypothetical protein HDU82_005956 [Entophlyctis luteolus]|nr:hypothetical protein HDU82_005956 [Entophlyctis luteolus]
MQRQYDVVVFGATGFTGKFVFEHLVLNGPANLKLAIAGRSKAKLEAVREALAATVANEDQKASILSIPILLADSTDQESLDAVAASTKVVVSTVGPFLQFGKPLVDSCVRMGTDYVDSTGESKFILDLINTYEQEAIAKRVRIVPSCGFDSLPSDIGSFLIADHFAKQGKKTESVRALVINGMGGISGGTLHTMAGIIASSSFSDLMRLSDPYIITPRSEEPENRPAASPVVLGYNKDLSLYEALSVMAAGNGAYVRRSWGLLKGAYGPNFQYYEAMAFNNIFQSALLVLGSTVGGSAMFFPPTRWLIKKLVPQGTNTASEQTLRSSDGFMKFVGQAEDGSKAIAEFKTRGDFGYVATGTMLAEAAMCLALDRSKLDASAAEAGSFGILQGGILTAASAGGMILVNRLQKIGFKISVADA